MGRDKRAHHRHADAQHKNRHVKAFGPAQKPARKPFVKTHIHHRNTHGQHTQQKHGRIACKGLSDHLTGQQMQKIGQQRHQDPGQPDRDRFGCKEDDGHGDDPQNRHGLSSSILRVMGHFPLNHFFRKPVLFNNIHQGLWGRQYKGYHNKNGQANTQPQ